MLKWAIFIPYYSTKGYFAHGCHGWCCCSGFHSRYSNWWCNTDKRRGRSGVKTGWHQSICRLRHPFWWMLPHARFMYEWSDVFVLGCNAQCWHHFHNWQSRQYNGILCCVSWRETDAQYFEQHRLGQIHRVGLANKSVEACCIHLVFCRWLGTLHKRM